MEEVILEIRNLRTYFYTYEGVVRALDGINLDIKKGEAVGLVGETGCGKSVTALSIMRLIQSPPGKIVGGEILFEGKNLLELTEDEMRDIRGNEIAMIFQEPMTSLNPVFTIESQMREIIMLHQKVGKDEAKKRALEMLKLVGMPDPEKVLKQYPHELSGGMRQRAMIAMEISCSPDLLIADEPTTALDVTIQAQILKLIKGIMGEIDASLLLITHDLGVIAKICDRVAVMYAGVIVEFADVRSIFKDPMHPYTKGLINAIPKLSEKRERLEIIRGRVPNLIHPPSGCRFHPRCDFRMDICDKEKPPAFNVKSEHSVACYLYKKVEEVAR
ncbi:MAG: ABC transporter ATP-binding protein [Candidatus Methanofastidiosia archaeon]